MKQLLFLKGLPASGKSTYAKKLVDDNPGAYKRVNKDDLRAMLDNSKWSRDNEKFVLKTRDMLILAALEDGKHVIVDDTNLAPKHEEHIKQLVKGLAEFQVVEFTLSPEECVERDLKRLNSVGAKVIWGMYNQFLKPKEVLVQDASLPIAVIFDVDGTLAHMKERGPFDWARVGEDEVDNHLRAITWMYRDRGHKILIFTGRDGCCEQETRQWLETNAIPFDGLFIRTAGDNRKDAIVKRELLEANVKGKYYIECIYDDRNQVVQMWRDLGLKCLQVQDGDF